MRNTTFAIAAIAVAAGAPMAARAQTVGLAPAPGVVVEGTPGITVERQPAFREYVIHERIPNHFIPDPVIVGGMLPESGVTYYEVPQSFAPSPYLYTVVNGETVLVEPRTRRIIQVLE